MVYTATITSKHQLTLPAALFKKLNLQEGQKLAVSLENNSLRLTPLMQLVQNLAGSISIPSRFKDLTVDQMIEKAKQEHFTKP